MPTAVARSVADFMFAGRVPDLQALEPWCMPRTPSSAQRFLVVQLNVLLVRYTAHSRSIFDDLSLGGSLLPSRTMCCVRHPGSQCLHNLPAFFLRSLPPALSVYVPVHLLAMLIRLPKLDVRTFLTDSLRSATFLATYCSGPGFRPLFACSSLPLCRYCLGAQSACCAYLNSNLLRQLTHPKIVYSGLAGALAGAAPATARHVWCLCPDAASGLGLLVELPRRRTELSVYCTQSAQAHEPPRVALFQVTLLQILLRQGCGGVDKLAKEAAASAARAPCHHSARVSAQEF